ncbi:MAG: hypothetical protein RLZZ354_523 [Pseudomonadota bacterium]|jgi:hypothetical protein
MIKTKTRIFNISSKNTSLNDSFKSRLSISLPDLSFHEKIENIYFSVQHAEIPNSFYVVNYTNNVIDINSISYTIPVGNYNANTLITALILLLPTYTITYNSITNRYTFNNTSSFTINSSSTCKNIIGLGNVSQSSISNSLTLPYSVNFVPLPRINLKSNFFHFNNFNGIDYSNDLFLSIQNNTNPNSMIHYLNQTGIKFRVEDKNITNFVISITDDDGNYINFNNQDTRISLQIDIEYISNINNSLTFSDLLKQ